MGHKPSLPRLYRSRVKSGNSIIFVGFFLIGASLGAAADLAGNAINEDTHVPFGGALGAVSVALGSAWWLGTKLTRFEDRLDLLSEQIKSMPCQERGKCLKDDL
jgi:hypothetical protein